MLEMLLKELTKIMLQIHKSLKNLNVGFNLGLDDKQLHFFIMAFLGMLLFFTVHAVFRRLAKCSITAISFIYVYTVMGAFGIAIEIGQHLYAKGTMDMTDVAAGQNGVLTFFGIYTLYRVSVMIIQKIIARRKEIRKEEPAEVEKQNDI